MTAIYIGVYKPRFVIMMMFLLGSRARSFLRLLILRRKRGTGDRIDTTEPGHPRQKRTKQKARSLAHSFARSLERTYISSLARSLSPERWTGNESRPQKPHAPSGCFRNTRLRNPVPVILFPRDCDPAPYLRAKPNHAEPEPLESWWQWWWRRRRRRCCCHPCHRHRRRPCHRCRWLLPFSRYRCVRC